MSEMSNIIVLHDEDGNEISFEFLDLIPYQGNEYILLLPVEGDASEVIILQLEPADNEDEEAYASVEDPAILEAVFNIFRQKFEEEFKPEN